MSADEPLYCQWCGYDAMACECDVGTWEPRPPREKRFCEVCGVVPAAGMECMYYQQGGTSERCFGRRNDDHYP